MPINPVLVVHGGAWAMPDDMVEAHINGVRNALAAGWSVLARGGAALDAVEEAVVIMEDDDTFDARRGSFLNRDGKGQLDALSMDGGAPRAGGVGAAGCGKFAGLGRPGSDELFEAAAQGARWNYCAERAGAGRDCA